MGEGGGGWKWEGVEEGKCKGEGEGYSTVKQCGTMIDNQWEPMQYWLQAGGGVDNNEFDKDYDDDDEFYLDELIEE